MACRWAFVLAWPWRRRSSPKSKAGRRPPTPPSTTPSTPCYSTWPTKVPPSWMIAAFARGAAGDPHQAGPREPGHAFAAQDRGHAFRHGLDRQVRLLVNDSYGTALRYITVLTDAPLPMGTPVESCRCGSCTACVDACPASAPSGRAWKPSLRREEFFNAVACYEEAVRQGMKAGGRIICGICIPACPHTRRYLAGRSVVLP